LRRNFRFDRGYQANKVKEAPPKTEDNNLQDDGFGESDAEAEASVDILEEDIHEHEEAKQEGIDSTEEHSDNEAFESEEQFSFLPAKLPGPLGFIDEDTLLLIVLVILLQSPRRDFSLILILLVLFINK